MMSDFGEALNGYVAAALQGELHGSEAVVDRLLAQGISAGRVYLDLIAPAQRMIGDLWLQGAIDVAAEHLATQVTLVHMDKLRPLLKRGESTNYKVGVTTPDGDYHFLGARMVADFLLADGWDVVFLGPSLPANSLARVAEEKGLRVVCLAVSLSEALPALAKAVAVLKGLKPAPAVLVGGVALSGLQNPLEETGADAVVQDAGDVAAAARRLVGLSAESQSFEQYLLTVGASIRRLRKERDWSQDRLAETAGLDRTYMSALENGKQNLTLKALMSIAVALDVTPEHLLAAR